MEYEYGVTEYELLKSWGSVRTNWAAFSSCRKSLPSRVSRALNLEE